MHDKVMDKMESAWRDTAGVAAGWKARTGGKVIGLGLTDVPEELVLAAGALPMTMMAREVPLMHADRHLQGFACSYSRSLVELAELGELDFLDGLVMPYACDTTRCMDLIFKYMQKFAFYDCLRIPRKGQGAGVKDYFREELMRLGQSLSAFTGAPVTKEGIAESIQAYNRVRAQLSAMREAMRERPGSISAGTYVSAVRAAMVLPPEDAARLTEEVLKEVFANANKVEMASPRVVVAGKIPEPPGVMRLLEESGLAVVEDHLVVGGRWVEASASGSGDPWEALVERQLERLPFSGIWDGRQNRASHLMQRVKDLSADAAVFLVQKFCEPAEIDLPGIKEELEKEGIPMLAVETDFSNASLAQARTRVEAFAEMLKEKRE